MTVRMRGSVPVSARRPQGFAGARPAAEEPPARRATSSLGGASSTEWLGGHRVGGAGPLGRSTHEGGGRALTGRPPQNPCSRAWDANVEEGGGGGAGGTPWSACHSKKKQY